MFSSEGLTKALFFPLQTTIFPAKTNKHHFVPNHITRSQSLNDVVALEKKASEKKRNEDRRRGELTDASQQASEANGTAGQHVPPPSPKNFTITSSSPKLTNFSPSSSPKVSKGKVVVNEQSRVTKKNKLRAAKSLPDIRKLSRDHNPKFIKELRLQTAGYGFLRALKRRKLQQVRFQSPKKVGGALLFLWV